MGIKWHRSYNNVPMFHCRNACAYMSVRRVRYCSDEWNQEWNANFRLSHTRVQFHTFMASLFANFFIDSNFHICKWWFIDLPASPSRRDRRPLVRLFQKKWIPVTTAPWIETTSNAPRGEISGFLKTGRELCLHDYPVFSSTVTHGGYFEEYFDIAEDPW